MEPNEYVKELLETSKRMKACETFNGHNSEKHPYCSCGSLRVKMYSVPQNKMFLDFLFSRVLNGGGDNIIPRNIDFSGEKDYSIKKYSEGGKYLIEKFVEGKIGGPKYKRALITAAMLGYIKESLSAEEKKSIMEKVGFSMPVVLSRYTFCCFTYDYYLSRYQYDREQLEEILDLPFDKIGKVSFSDNGNKFHIKDMEYLSRKMSEWYRNKDYERLFFFGNMFITKNTFESIDSRFIPFANATFLINILDKKVLGGYRSDIFDNLKYMRGENFSRTFGELARELAHIPQTAKGKPLMVNTNLYLMKRNGNPNDYMLKYQE